MSDNPTIDEYRTALAECVAEKAADWKAACDSAEAASKEINRLRLTEEEREAMVRLCDAVTDYAADDRKTNGEMFAADDERAVAIVRAWLARLT